MGMKETLDRLIADAMMPDNEIAVRNLLQELEKIDVEILKETSEALGNLCISWEEGVTKSEDKANICVLLAELSVLDTPEFRGPLHAAIRKLLPPYLASGAVVKAIGAKDENVTAAEAALRLRKLQHLRSTALVYQQDTYQWSKIHSIDNVTGTIAISSLGGGSVSSVPIASAIFTLHFFNMTPDMMNLLYPGKVNYRPSAEYRKVFSTASLSRLHDQKLHDIVQRLMVPSIMSLDTFEAWWKVEGLNPAAKTNGRAYWDARSVLELYTLLAPLIKEDKVTISAEAAQTLEKLFACRIRKDMQPKEITMLTECISALANANSAAVLTPMFQPLRGKVCFWPSEITDTLPLTALEPWGKLSVKLLTGFVKVSAMLYTPEELALLATQLPLKCIGPVFEALPDQIVHSTILAQKTLSCDMILWIYRNRTSLPHRITTAIDMARCISALSVENLPREWTAAQRDLRKALFDKADFQKYIIENADGDIPSIIGGLQRYRNFQHGERQSVMVKLSRQSEEIKDYLESGAGSKLMGAAAKTRTEEAPLTSLASHKRLTDELHDLISVQIPENAAAVALARSYGDLRENAEYDAAKERRRYLHRRRAELEKTLSFIQPTDFKNVVINDHAVVGSVVILTAADGSGDREYYLLGAWDGDPEKRYVSYKTKIGEALLDKKIGSQVEIPGAGKFTIKAVQALPETLRKALACEE